MRASAFCLLFLAGCGLSVVGSAAQEGDAGRTEPDGSADSSIREGGPDGSTDGPIADGNEAGAPVLQYVRAAALGSVNLTSEGSLDWIHWGATASAPFSTRKAGVTPLAFDYVVAGPAPQSISASSDNPISFSWTDGTPDATQSGSSTHVSFTGTADATVLLDVATFTTTRTARFYLALNRTRARFEIGFDDDSVPIQSEEIEKNDGALPLVFTVMYRHPSPTTRLRVRWTMLTVVDPAESEVRISAVTVQ